MAVARYLVDKSVWARVAKPAVRAALEPLIIRGLVGTTGVIDLEMLYSARNGAEHDLLQDRRRAFEWFATNDDIIGRAIEVQNALAHRNEHRAVSLPDLLIAATAERHGLTVLHYDGDFDLIAKATGQPVEWVVPAGTAD
ncbi:twitching motility protein PilT [Streptomyces sp. CB02923]|uniref:PIN domain nuclease n=1 Tax=Streptomyces sp. CB02923 TaxID=1718985 RepID=UPI00093C7B1B|nr:PIN domain nuclease [Streptomyces sp. CB02923]OKI09573.1 twitching motility protein PilT [Streptomyces sp. CB02923]